MPSRFLDPLDIRDMGDGLNWVVLHEFRFVTKSGDMVAVPAGAETDFASIPRFLWRIAPPATGRHRRAAVVHDWIYRTPDLLITRERADEIFLEGMEVDGTAAWLRQAMYRSVRMFGGSSYQERLA